jgi:hypothetical protein
VHARARAHTHTYFILVISVTDIDKKLYSEIFALLGCYAAQSGS